MIKKINAPLLPSLGWKKNIKFSEVFMKKIILAIAFAAHFSSLEVGAQIYIPQLDPVGTYLQQQVFQQMAFGEMYKEMIVNGKKVRVRTSTPPAAPAKTTKSVTEFSPAGGRILPARLSGAAGNREARQTFDMFLDAYEKTAQSDGLSPNDLAYGFEFFIFNNYTIFNDLKDKNPADKALMSASGDPLLALQHRYSKQAGAVSPAAEKVLYGQIKTFLSANPAIANLTDRQKQEFTEMLALVTVSNWSMYEMAGKNNDAEMFAKAQSTAKQMLEKMFGVAADKIKITAKGLEF